MKNIMVKTMYKGNKCYFYKDFTGFNGRNCYSLISKVPV